MQHWRWGAEVRVKPGRTRRLAALLCAARASLGADGPSRVGGPHAEVLALAQAGALAKGATAYVTLEPCAHVGKTPPCATALIAAGVSSGRRGNRRQRCAGVWQRVRDAARGGYCRHHRCFSAQSAAQDHAGFLLKTGLGRPWVTLKLANSFDGRIATASGESRWITGPEARRAVHSMRMRHDAVMVGGGTARSDDPDLTIRGLGSGATTSADCGVAAARFAVDGAVGALGAAGAGLDLPRSGCRG